MEKREKKKTNTGLGRSGMPAGKHWLLLVGRWKNANEGNGLFNSKQLSRALYLKKVQ